MYKREPLIYVPIEPVDNGIALPTALSLLVHGSIIAFILFSHRVPEVETPETIETSIVSPEELADIQANIIANREAKIYESTTQQNIINDQNTATAPNTANFNQPRPTTEYASQEYPDYQLEDYDTNIIENSLPVDNSYEFNDFEEIDNNVDEINKKASDSTNNDEFDVAKPDNAQANEVAGAGENPNTSLHSGQVGGLVKAAIDKKWNPPDTYNGKKIKVKIVTGQNGKVLEVIYLSGDKVLLPSLIEAINSIGTLPGLEGRESANLAGEFIVTS